MVIEEGELARLILVEQALLLRLTQWLQQAQKKKLLKIDED